MFLFHRSNHYSFLHDELYHIFDNFLRCYFLNFFLKRENAFFFSSTLESKFVKEYSFLDLLGYLEETFFLSCNFVVEYLEAIFR